jgi:cell division protein FtsL
VGRIRSAHIIIAGFLWLVYIFLTLLLIIVETALGLIPIEHIGAALRSSKDGWCRCERLFAQALLVGLQKHLGIGLAEL